jgi:hypothetical protein
MIVTGYGTLAIEDDDCVRILDEAGFLPTSGIASVYLIDIPRGLNAKETEKFLRDNGAKICGSRLARSPDGVGSALGQSLTDCVGWRLHPVRMNEHGRRPRQS